MPPTRERALRSRVVAIAASLALTLVAPHARADDEVDQPSIQAEKLAEQAEARIALGDYRGALDLYTEANRIAPAAVFAFDMAWIYERLGFLDQAILAYHQCTGAIDVEPALAGRARERILAIQRERPGSLVSDDNVIIPPVAPGRSSSWHPMKTGALVAGGAGVVALGIGTTFALIAKSKDNEAQQYCDGDRCTDPRALTLTDDATSAAHVADFAIVTGAVLVAGGVALWLLAPRSQSAVGVSVRGRSLVLGGAW